jgi:hypothetical protein
VLCNLFLVNLSVAETTSSDTLSELKKAYKADSEKVVLPTATPTKDTEEFTLYKYAQFKMEEESNRRLLAICGVVGSRLVFIYLSNYLTGASLPQPKKQASLSASIILHDPKHDARFVSDKSF